MKKHQKWRVIENEEITSYQPTIMPISIAGLIIWRFVGLFPDWLVRLIGDLLSVFIFTTVLSTVKNFAAKK